MSDSVRPHRRQPTRLLRPWDSPGKNTGVGCHFLLQCMKVKSESEVAQSCLTLRDSMDCSLPGSSVHGIFQARVLEWVAIAFSTTFSLGMQKKNTGQCLSLFTLYYCVCVCVHAKSLWSYLTLCDPMDYSLQAPLPVGFSRQVYWSELSCPPPGDLPHPGIEPECPAL